MARLSTQTRLSGRRQAPRLSRPSRSSHWLRVTAKLRMPIAARSLARFCVKGAICLRSRQAAFSDAKITVERAECADCGGRIQVKSGLTSRPYPVQ